MGCGQGRRARMDPNRTGPQTGARQPAGSRPAEFRLPSLPPFFLGPGSGCPSLARGARCDSRGPCFPAPPIRALPTIAVTSRPWPCSSQLGLRAAAVADPRPWGKNTGFRWPFGGQVIKAWIISRGSRRTCRGRSRRRGQGTRFLWVGWGGVERCVQPDTWLPPGTAFPSQRDLGLETTKCSRETRS